MKNYHLRKVRWKVTMKKFLHQLASKSESVLKSCWNAPFLYLSSHTYNFYVKAKAVASFAIIKKQVDSLFFNKKYLAKKLVVFAIMQNF